MLYQTKKNCKDHPYTPDIDFVFALTLLRCESTPTALLAKKRLDTMTGLVRNSEVVATRRKVQDRYCTCTHMSDLSDK